MPGPLTYTNQYGEGIETPWSRRAVLEAPLRPISKYDDTGAIIHMLYARRQHSVSRCLRLFANGLQRTTDRRRRAEPRQGEVGIKRSTIGARLRQRLSMTIRLRLRAIRSKQTGLCT